MAVYIDQELCKSCKICINTCPKNVFEITHKVNKKGYNYVEAVRANVRFPVRTSSLILKIREEPAE